MAKIERRIGETFRFRNVKLKVEKSECLCIGCYLFDNEICNSEADKIVGNCCVSDREDRQEVIFVKVED